MSLISVFMSVILSLGCHFEQAELIKAQELILQGNEEKAFDLYEKIIKDNPNTPLAAEAESRLQLMYERYAKRVSAQSDATATQLNQAIILRWPESTYAKNAQQRLTKLEAQQKTVNDDKLVDQQACASADADNSREAWNGYLKKHPFGICKKKAKKRLALTEPDLKQRTGLRKYIERCEEVQRVCNRLEIRFETLKVQEEEEYLRGTFFEYLRNTLMRYDGISKEGNVFLADLSSRNVDTHVLTQQLTKGCGGCKSGRKNLQDLKLCREAARKKDDVLWAKYDEQYPHGGCSVARKKRKSTKPSTSKTPAKTTTGKQPTPRTAGN